MKVFFFLSLIPGYLMASIHPEFVSLSQVCPDFKIEASYAGPNNFTGGIVAGYLAKRAYMAKLPAEALCKVQKDAVKKGFGIKIFDGYRPVKAVQFFQAWAQKAEDNVEIKNFYYPKFSRLELFEQGFIAKQSSHSRGSAVDLTLFDLRTGGDLDMGGHFDFFDEVSYTLSPLITPQQQKNRLILKEMMEGRGFKNFSQEWWHYSFRPEPFPAQAFDFDVE